MSIGLGSLPADHRSEDRDEVHYRARAIGGDARQHTLLVVNISPHGLMGRCDSMVAEGERLQVQLPVIGTIAAEVRWSLGGRIGCQFDKPVDLAGYYEMVAAMLRGK
jgi:PilZ domain-containing protein